MPGANSAAAAKAAIPMQFGQNSSGGQGSKEGVAFVLDLTVRKRAEQALQLQATLDLIPAMAWRARADGVIEYINKRWLDYTGVSLDQVLGWQWLALIHPDDAPPMRDAWLQTLASEKPGE